MYAQENTLRLVYVMMEIARADVFVDHGYALCSMFSAHHAVWESLANDENGKEK